MWAGSGDDTVFGGDGSDELHGARLLVLRDRVGEASVTSDGGATRTLGAGEFFGEIALLEDGRRTATVTAASPLDLLVLWAATSGCSGASSRGSPRASVREGEAHRGHSR